MTEYTARPKSTSRRFSPFLCLYQVRPTSWLTHALSRPAASNAGATLSCESIADHLLRAANPGMRATCRLIASRYVLKGLFMDVTAWARVCLHCQRAKVHRHVRVSPQNITVPTRHFSHIHLDLVGPLPPSKGFTHLFTVMDRTSRWPEAIPIAATTTVDCANALFQGWVTDQIWSPRSLHIRPRAPIHLKSWFFIGLLSPVQQFIYNIYIYI
jgi:hypothetical protein